MTLTPWRRADREPLEAGLPQRVTESARRFLVSLPDQLALLARLTAGEHLHGPSEVRSAKPGSRALASLSIVSLLDGRRREVVLDPAGEANLSRRAGARRAGVVPTLAAWVDFAYGEMLDRGEECTDPEAELTAVRVTGWLVRHWDWIIAQAWARDLVAEIHSIEHDVRECLSEREDYRPTCICGGRLEVSGGAAVCSGCSVRVVDGRLGKIAVVRKPMLLKDAAAIAGVSSATAYRWVADGLLWPEVDGDGHELRQGRSRLYAVGDLLALVDTSTARQRRS